MTIRERITELTANVKTVVELDAVVSRGALQTLRAEFPNADAAEIMYEWDSMKLRIRKMV
mgnify:CR=1 FL=1